MPAPVTGIVQYSGFNSAGYGNTVIIKATDGTFHLLAHLDGTSMPWAGEWVTAGATVGAVGQTGRSTGPHLHYEILQAGTAVSAGTGGSLGFAASNQGVHMNPDTYSGTPQYDSGAASAAYWADFLGAYSFTKASPDPFTAGIEELLAAVEVSWSNPNLAAPLQGFLDRNSGTPGWSVTSIPGGYSIAVPINATGTVADMVGTGLASTMSTFLAAQKRLMTVYSTAPEPDASTDTDSTLEPGATASEAMESAAVSSIGAFSEAQSGNALVATIKSTSESLTIQDWYLSANNRVEEFRLNDGTVLTNVQAQALVGAMAAFNPSGVGIAMLDDSAPHRSRAVVLAVSATA